MDTDSALSPNTLGRLKTAESYADTVFSDGLSVSS
ncbi:hypothetical protein J2T38_001950 [Neisseria perflava]|nr:hypothetical protein [Neisseria perflava]